MPPLNSFFLMAGTPLSKSPGRIEEVAWQQDTCQKALEDAMRLQIETPVQFKDLHKLVGVKGRWGSR